MAFQILKPIETYGFIFQGVEENDKVDWRNTQQRAPMTAGRWAQLRTLDGALLEAVPAMVERVSVVMGGSNTSKKNAIHLLQLALEHPHPYVSCLLAVTGIDAILNSSDRYDFEKKLVGQLGENALAFPDWNSYGFRPPPYAVAQLAVHLYTLRSKIAHGADFRKAAQDKKSPVDLLQLKEYIPEDEPVNYSILLGESSIYLLCQLLQRTL